MQEAGAWLKWMAHLFFKIFSVTRPSDFLFAPPLFLRWNWGGWCASHMHPKVKLFHQPSKMIHRETKKVSADRENSMLWKKSKPIGSKVICSSSNWFSSKADSLPFLFCLHLHTLSLQSFHRCTFYSFRSSRLRIDLNSALFFSFQSSLPFFTCHTMIRQLHPKLSLFYHTFSFLGRNRQDSRFLYLFFVRWTFAHE